MSYLECRWNDPTQRCSSTMMLFLVVVYLMHLIHGKSDTLTTRSDRLHIWAMHGHSHYRTSCFIVFGMSTYLIWFHSLIYKKNVLLKIKMPLFWQLYSQMSFKCFVIHIFGFLCNFWINVQLWSLVRIQFHTSLLMSHYSAL